jgi:ribosomal-protein-serine acetyltransferase
MVDESLELRQTMPEVAEEMFAVVDANREYLREWLPWLDNTNSPDDETTFINGLLEEYRKGESINYAIRFDGRFIGGMGLNWVDHGNRGCGVGYWLSEEFTGQGIVTRCCGRLMDHCFDDLGLHRFVLEAATKNIASRAVAERLGMRLEGTTKDREWLYDHYVDSALYAITAPEWRAQNQG